MLSVFISDNHIKITGKNRRYIITTSRNAIITIEEVAREKKKDGTENIHRYIRIRKTAMKGVIEIVVRFLA